MLLLSPLKLQCINLYVCKKKPNICLCSWFSMYTSCTEVLGHPLLINRFDYLSNFPNVYTHNYILGNCVLPIFASVQNEMTDQLWNQQRKLCLGLQCSLFHFSSTSLAETASCIPIPAYKNAKHPASHNSFASTDKCIIPGLASAF